MPHPKTHLTPTVSATPLDEAWREWSQAWTRHIPVLTGRTDLTVTVAPGAAGTADACFYPHQRRIEVDAVHIGNPGVANPRRAGHKKLVPTAYGLLVHEASHAAHSHWDVPAGTPPVVADVALLLEESRAEGRQRARRRGDRRWLRHTVTTLLDPGDAPVDDAWHAGQLAGLLLARVDARIITSTQVRTVRAAVATVLGRNRLSYLRRLWKEAHAVADTDADTMIRIAVDWCHVLGVDPGLRPNPPEPDPTAFPGRLAAAITGYLAASAGLTTTQYLERRLAARHAAPATWTTRDPAPDEQRAARLLAARLRRARTDPTEPATRPATAPPGRLRVRHAITADAQAAAGMVPTAAPWQRRTIQPPHKPTLRLAVLVDVSGSMGDYAAPMSSAGWILAHAARRADAATTTIAFGDTVTLLIPPHQHPTQVLEMEANDGTEEFVGAVQLADQLLDLRRPGAVRMLAVVSDGHFFEQYEAAQKVISAMHGAGCAVLWLHPGQQSSHIFDDTIAITVENPIGAIGHIADAAITALVRQPPIAS
ncbi:hypothetical protein GCM10023322_78990 [Rugosimonospora acidiphila]|uniref:VWA domain containing CoxE-like protein n=1 Tax=Rugosimonospora acidiphila TaxID=556531 RepID=A0ABP9STW8_9ACTN